MTGLNVCSPSLSRSWLKGTPPPLPLEPGPLHFGLRCSKTEVTWFMCPQLQSAMSSKRDLPVPNSCLCRCMHLLCLCWECRAHKFSSTILATLIKPINPFKNQRASNRVLRGWEEFGKIPNKGAWFVMIRLLYRQFCTVPFHDRKTKINYFKNYFNAFKINFKARMLRKYSHLFT